MTKTVWGLDTETWLLSPGNQVPKLVCMSLYNPEGKQQILLERERAVPKFRELLEDPNVTIVIFNAPFDLAVLCRQDWSFAKPIIQAIRDGRIRCVRIRAMLFDIASGDFAFRRQTKGGYSLAGLVKRKFDVELAKEDTWRLRYGLLDGVKAEDYPVDARTYALEDARWHYLAFAKQETDLQEDDLDEVPDERPQLETAFWMYLMQAWGVRTDPEYVAKLDREMTTEMNALRVKLLEQKIVRAKTKRDLALLAVTPAAKLSEVCAALAREKKVSLDTKLVQRLVEEDCNARGEKPALTATGLICIDDEELKKTTDPKLAPLRRFLELNHNYGLYMRYLKAGTTEPIHPSWNVLVETGRTSCRAPNAQQLPRKGGFRECFKARPGYVFAFCDYDTLELRTHAQNCLELIGYSRLADALKAGKDPHSDFGSQLLDISYEEMLERLKDGDPIAEDARQRAKPASFGIPGGMGVNAFVAYAAGYGVKLTFEQGKALKDRWLATYTENVEYFRRTSDIVGDGTATLIQIGSGRVRGKCRYTDYNNGLFQSRAADGAKDAFRAVSYECYLDETSPLFGCRPIGFYHDEIGLEIPARSEASVSAAALRLQQVMEERMQVWIPDIPAKASVAVMPRWYKGAKQVLKNGLLVASQPFKTEDGKTKWIEAEVKYAA